MSVEVTHWLGVWLGAMALVVTVFVVAWLVHRKNQRLVLPALLRGLAATLLCVSLAGILLVRSEQFSRGTILVDISESMDEGRTQKLLDRAVQYAGPQAELQVVPFAKGVASQPLPGSQGLSYSALRTSWGKLNIGGSNLEAALRSMPPGDGQNIILISDGFETEGDVQRVLPELVAHRSKVFPLLPSESEPDTEQFRISQLHLPLIAPAQKSVEIRTSVSNSTATSQSGLLEIKHGERVVLSKQVTIDAGKEAVVIAESDPQAEGIREVTATLRPLRRDLGESLERAYLSSEEREKVLLLSGAAEDERILKQVLKEQAYQVKGLLAGQEEISKLNLSEYSAVLFNNVGREALPRKIIESVPEYVKAGGGFLMIGGNRSFGLGGYIDSPIEPVLPVELVPPQAEKKRLNVAVALVLDKSGSMNQSGKLDYAKEAAIETVRNLKDDDFITVIGFDDAPFVVIRASRVADVRYEAAGRIGMLVSNGRTNLLPAIDEARRNLERVEAGRKHIIVLTDGRLPDEGPFYIEITKELRMLGFTLSTVLLGSDTDYQFLKGLADVGGGGFYQTNDARNLPRIFLQDVRVSTGERTMKESTEYDVRVGSGALLSTTLRSFPAVRGYVQTKGRPQAAVELVALAADRAEPLLASWRYGKGRSVAFTSDANGRWSSYWMQWPKLYQFWTELVDSLRGEGVVADAPVRFNLRSTIERAELKLTLEIFGDRDPGDITATAILPSGAERTVSFVRVAKGLYESRLKAAIPGRYELRGIAAHGGKLTPVSFYVSGELFGERKGLGFNRVLLERIASETGGQSNPAPQTLSQFAYTRYLRQDVSQWLIVAAMVALLMSILLREVPGVFKGMTAAALNRFKIKKSINSRV
jgi:uncharacterized membrane protein